ncbi:hypothetical protein VE04_08948 [Pseudogymnoascus sp. 24MN13]|nr:hypothetical protein VE04_08948 [Pseudogymnoascus sp. 24MN13]
MSASSMPSSAAADSVRHIPGRSEPLPYNAYDAIGIEPSLDYTTADITRAFVSAREHLEHARATASLPAFPTIAQADTAYVYLRSLHQDTPMTDFQRATIQQWLGAPQSFRSNLPVGSPQVFSTASLAASGLSEHASSGPSSPGEPAPTPASVDCYGACERCRLGLKEIDDGDTTCSSCMRDLAAIEEEDFVCEYCENVFALEEQSPLAAYCCFECGQLVHLPLRH